MWCTHTHCRVQRSFVEEGADDRWRLCDDDDDDDDDDDTE